MCIYMPQLTEKTKGKTLAQRLILKEGKVCFLTSSCIKQCEYNIKCGSSGD
jgi:hypothetical protein